MPPCRKVMPQSPTFRPMPNIPFHQRKEPAISFRNNQFAHWPIIRDVGCRVFFLPVTFLRFPFMAKSLKLFELCKTKRQPSPWWSKDHYSTYGSGFSQLSLLGMPAKLVNVPIVWRNCWQPRLCQTPVVMFRIEGRSMYSRS